MCFAVRGFRKRCSKARFREAQKIVFVDSKGNVKEFFGAGFGRFRLVSRLCLGLFASKATACVLLFEAFGSGVLRPDFATGFFGSGFGRFRLVSRWCLGLFASKATACVLLFEAFGPVFCCSRLSEAVFQARFREAQKIVVFVDSKGNVKQFFGSGFGRFRLVSRWCLGLFASTATACVLLFEAFGSGVLWLDFATVLQRVSGCCFLAVSSLIEGSCASSLLFLNVVTVFPRLGMCSCGPQELFLDSKGNVQDFFDRVLAVFGSCPGVWDFSHLRLPLVFCCSRLSEAVF